MRKAFTLVEMLIVVVVLVTLMTVTFRLGAVNKSSWQRNTTAVRIIPVAGKKVGDTVEFGGLLGHAPVMKVSKFSCADMVARKGRIPAPIHSFKN